MSGDAGAASVGLTEISDIIRNPEGDDFALIILEQMQQRHVLPGGGGIKQQLVEI